MEESYNKYVSYMAALCLNRATIGENQSIESPLNIFLLKKKPPSLAFFHVRCLSFLFSFLHPLQILLLSQFVIKIYHSLALLSNSFTGDNLMVFCRISAPPPPPHHLYILFFFFETTESKMIFFSSFFFHHLLKSQDIKIFFFLRDKNISSLSIIIIFFTHFF